MPLKDLRDKVKQADASAARHITLSIEQAEHVAMELERLAAYRRLRATDGGRGRTWDAAANAQAELDLHLLGELGSTEWHIRYAALNRTREIT
jgi:hypothetical protein